MKASRLEIVPLLRKNMTDFVSLLKRAEITATGRWVFADISGSSERRDADAGRKTYFEWLGYGNAGEFDGSF